VASVVGTLSLPTAGVACVSIRADGKIFGAGGWDRRLRLYAFHSLKPLAVLKLHSETVQGVAFAAGCAAAAGATPSSLPAGFLASASKDKTIAVYDLY
jgi:WD40 repeat protein